MTSGSTLSQAESHCPTRCVCRREEQPWDPGLPSRLTEAWLEERGSKGQEQWEGAEGRNKPTAGVGEMEVFHSGI